MPYATTSDGVQLYFEKQDRDVHLFLCTNSPATCAVSNSRCSFRQEISHSCVQCPRVSALRRTGGRFLLFAGSSSR